APAPPRPRSASRTSSLPGCRRSPGPAPPPSVGRYSQWPPKADSWFALRSSYRFKLVIRGGRPADHFYHARHAHVAVAHRRAAAAADAGHRELALDEVVRQLAEEAAVAAVMHGAARVEAAGHTRKAAQRAGVPDADPLYLVRADLAIADGKAGASRADISAAAALQAAVADFLP